MKAPGMATITLSLDTAPYDAAFASLEKVACRFPKQVVALLDACNRGAQIARFDPSDEAAGAGQLRLVLQPSDLLRNFLAAALAGELERFVVEI